MVMHAPFLTTLRPGFVVVTAAGGKGEERYFVTGGFAEISDDVVSVLAENAVTGDAVTGDWLDGQIAEAETALENAAEDRKQAARQKVDDLQTVRAGM